VLSELSSVWQWLQVSLSMVRGIWSNVALASVKKPLSPEREDRSDEDARHSSSAEESAQFCQIPLTIDIKRRYQEKTERKVGDMSAQDNLAPGPSVHPWVSDGAKRIRFGISAAAQSWPEMHDLAQMAEGLGFDSFWRVDHPLLGHDGWTTLAALAAVTRTIRLGTHVSCVAYRPPVLLARMAADIDAISNGRLVLGLGSGDMPREFQQLGLAYPTIQQRQAALEEAIRIIRPLLRGETVTFAGTHYRANGAVLRPPPVQQPYIPLLIGGGGERTTLRYVAESADISSIAAASWAGGAYTPADAGRKFQVLQRRCEEAGRSYSSILRATQFGPLILAETEAGVQAKLDRFPKALLAFLEQTVLATTPGEAIKRMQALVDVGFQYFLCGIAGNDVETLNLLAQQVIPALLA
jgi:alkanesulfonate monooxygenase SsuD/methylene tetrahydromethanopterin reductase-like flavin-dependent oxidoreductase (luciferase family)